MKKYFIWVGTSLPDLKVFIYTSVYGNVFLFYLTEFSLGYLWWNKVCWGPEVSWDTRHDHSQTLSQIGFTSSNCFWQRGTKYWAAVSADIHGASSHHGSCYLGATFLKVTPRRAQVTEDVSQRFLGRKVNTTRPRLHMLPFCLWWQDFRVVRPLPMDPMPPVLQKTLPPVPSAALWGEEPGPEVLSNTGGCYGSSPMPFQGCHRILWDVPRLWGHLVTSGWRAGQIQWRNAAHVALFLCKLFIK